MPKSSTAKSSATPWRTPKNKHSRSCYTQRTRPSRERVLFSTGFPPYHKGCSMGAERVIKGCSAQDHPNVTPRIFQKSRVVYQFPCTLCWLTSSIVSNAIRQATATSLPPLSLCLLAPWRIALTWQFERKEQRGASLRP